MNILQNLEQVDQETGVIYGPLTPGEYHVIITDWQLIKGKNGKADFYQLHLEFTQEDEGRKRTETYFNGSKTILLSQLAQQLDLAGNPPSTIIKAALESELKIWAQRNEQYLNVYFTAPAQYTPESDATSTEEEVDDVLSHM